MMEIEEPVTKIFDFLTKARSGFKFTEGTTVEEINSVLPSGLVSDDYNILKALHRFCSGWDGRVWIRKITIYQGLVRAHPGGDDRELNWLFYLLSQTPARRSATRCLVCGKRGYRRKREKFWPSLCEWHYIQYVNWLDQNGLGTTEGSF